MRRLQQLLLTLGELGKLPNRYQRALAERCTLTDADRRAVLELCCVVRAISALVRREYFDAQVYCQAAAYMEAGHAPTELD